MSASTLAEPPQITPRPLVVSGVWVTKRDLLDALRIYLPTVQDIESSADGSRFLLAVSPPTDGDGRPA